jgi:hypothetical protein
MKTAYRDKIAVIIAAITIAAINSCAPKPKMAPPAPIQIIPTPYDLKAEAANGKATLYWKVDRPANFISGGYNIYLAENSNDTGRLYNNVPYPGDTDGDVNSESIVLTELKDAQFYYAWIAALSAKGLVGSPSVKIEFMPLEQGELLIYFDMLADSSGYSFAMRKYTKARDFDNDFYLYDKDGPYISSPSLYNSGLRKSVFRDNISRFNEKSNPVAHMALAQGKEFGILTADGGLAKMAVVNFGDSAKSKSATLKYIYVPLTALSK